MIVRAGTMQLKPKRAVKNAFWIASGSLCSRIMRLASSVALLAILGCGHRSNDATSGRTTISVQVANLHAFARLYGLVRWFHPSDAAAAIDWDRFAVDGVRQVIDAPDVRALRERLTELFAAVAPTMYIAGPGEPLRDAPALHPNSFAGLDVIAWQHKGYGDSTIATGYSSKRLHRARTVALPGALFASLFQRLDAAPFRGARMRLRGKLRTGVRARGQLWLRVDSGDASHFFDNMDRHPVVSEPWAAAEIVGPVAADATAITLGVLNSSSGTVWYDDLELAVEKPDGAWATVRSEERRVGK